MKSWVMKAVSLGLVSYGFRADVVVVVVVVFVVVDTGCESG